MVTSKERAQEIARARMSPGVKGLIEHIEKEIANKYTGHGYSGSRLIIYPHDVPAVKAETSSDRFTICHIVVGLYKANGWNAKYESHQRDGVWIELS